MAITLNGTTGITTPDITSAGSLNIDASAPDDSLVVDSAGNVGIGTDSPTERLVLSSTSTACFIRLSNSGNNGNYIGSRDGDLEFYANSAERARIDSSGRLLLNTTSLTAGTTTSNCLLTLGGTSSPMMKFQSTTGPNAWDLYPASGATFYFAYNTVDKASINSSTGAYTALSDVRKKKDFEESTLGLDEVMQLQPKLFRMLDDADDAPKQLGFVAQDVQSVIPQAYSEQESGNGTFIGLQDRPFIAVLVKAIQEQQATITALTARIEALENNIV